MALGCAVDIVAAEDVALHYAVVGSTGLRAAVQQDRNIAIDNGSRLTVTLSATIGINYCATYKIDGGGVCVCGRYRFA